jgi:hypothetical protein
MAVLLDDKGDKQECDDLVQRRTDRGRLVSGHTTMFVETQQSDVQLEVTSFLVGGIASCTVYQASCCRQSRSLAADFGRVS